MIKPQFPRKHIGSISTLYYSAPNVYHRTDGPAVELPGLFKAWYIHGKLHRYDGPAVEFADGTKQYWINDKQYTEEAFLSYDKRKCPDYLK